MGSICAVGYAPTPVSLDFDVKTIHDTAIVRLLHYDHMLCKAAGDIHKQFSFCDVLLL